MSERAVVGKLADAYDAVVIGAGNGGLGAGLALAVNGVKPLVLERHNIPGGFATSFVRGRFEFEVSLHELSDVGPPDMPGGVRDFLDGEAKLGIEWMPIPEAYRVILSDRGLNVRLPFGKQAYIDAIADAVPGSRESVENYIALCQGVYDTFGYLGRMSSKPDLKQLVGDLSEFLKNSDNPVQGINDLAATIGNFVKVAPRTVEEVTRSFNMPDDAVQLLYPYWCYLGIPMERMSFPIWGSMLISYLTKGAYVPKNRSQEMTAAMEARIRELGGRVEFNTEVTRILTEKGRVTGVETNRGDVIRTSHVVSNASPTLVYGKLMDPAAAPKDALKLINARTLGASGFVVYLGLDKSAEDLGLTDYGYFIAGNMDSRAIHDTWKTLSPTAMQATTCLNLAVPDCSPPGTSLMCITVLNYAEAWEHVTPGEYYRLKNRIAGQLIDQFEAASGCGIRDHIEEIEVATPATFARYTGAYNGGIYGYEPEPWDSVLPRAMSEKDEAHIKGLEFAGGFAFMGHGYSPSLLSGRTAALKTIAAMGGTS